MAQYCEPASSAVCNELPSDIPPCIAGQICVTNTPLPPNTEPFPFPNDPLTPFPTPTPGFPGVPGFPGGAPQPPGRFPAPRRGPAPRLAAPPPIAAPTPPPSTLPEVVVSGSAPPGSPGLVPFGPIGEAVGPVFLFGGPGVTLQEARLAQLQALLNEPLLQETTIGFSPPGEPPPLELGPPRPGPVELPKPGIGVLDVDVSATEVAPGQLSLFEPEAPSIAEVASQVVTKPSVLQVLGGLVSKAFGATALLLTPTEAGFPPGVEEALVAARLTKPFGLPPLGLADVTGLPESALEPIPTITDTVVVSAPRAAPAVPVDPFFGVGPVLLGTPEIPAIGPVVNPQRATRPTTAPAPRSSTRPAPVVGPLGGETGGPGPSRFPGERGFHQPTGAPKPSAQPDPLNPGAASTCTTAPEKKKKKKQQKKQPRTICYRGTYTELKSGLIKHRKERIECR